MYGTTAPARMVKRKGLIVRRGLSSQRVDMQTN